MAFLSHGVILSAGGGVVLDDEGDGLQQLVLPALVPLLPALLPATLLLLPLVRVRVILVLLRLLLHLSQHVAQQPAIGDVALYQSNRHSRML